MQSSTHKTSSVDIHIYLGADHGGFAVKEQIKEWFEKTSKSYTDLGAFSLEPTDDYPPIAFAVSKAVARDLTQAAGTSTTLGILFCRSGGGMSIAANKVTGIRAVPVLSVQEAQHAREHNDAQIISIAADWLSEEKIKDIIQAFISTPASQDPRHVRRIAQIKQYEESK